MKLNKTKIIIIAIVFFSLPIVKVGGIASFAQNVGINTTGNAPNSSALLDVDASPGNNKGILIPRLPLTASNVGAPISPAPGAAEKGLMVYNTATAGISPNDVVPGFYFWTGSAWSPLGGGGSTAGGWTDDGTVVRLTTSTDFVGIGTASPAATSALDITSTTKGILIPRMTTAQRDAIATPATGLQIYNTDCKVLNYWSGTCWISMSKSLPNPGPITSAPASTVFCAGQSRTYTIAAVAGSSSYTWTVPAGTTINSGQGTVSINATFGNISGSVCVNANNACETSGQTCLAVSVDPIPNTPGNITGITSINPGQQSVTYFVASVNGASTYTWSVPAGATIASGTGTTTIVVNFACNASSGNISVTANSTCGSSPASALALTITPLLAASAGAAVFGGVAIGGSPTASGGTTAYTYSWSPATNLSSSTVANPTALCVGSTATYTVTVTDSRSCTATSSVVVTRNLIVSAGAAKFGGATIGGAPTATGGNPTYTYSWSPTSDLSSSTVANPTALCTGSTTTYTVTATDANGCTGTSSVVVTRNLAVSAGAAKFGGTTIGNTAAGGNPTYTYSWNPATNLSSSTVAVPTALCTGATTTYTVTATDANGCTATSSVVVTRNLTASAGANQSMAVNCSKTLGGSPTALGGNATYSYSWNPTSGLSNATVANPTSTVGSTTTYTVTVTDGNSCTATSSMTLTVGVGTVTFNNTSTGKNGTIQSWTVPAGVTCVNIEAWGAQGGSASGGAGGLGARMKGTFTVAAGNIIQILVGQQGVNNTANPGSRGGGGGGGTFIYNQSTATLLIASGGGGGAGQAGYGDAASYSNSVVTANGRAGYAGGAGGTGGGGGGASTYGGGGAGWNSNGGNSGYGQGGVRFLGGGAGGALYSDGADGGFGGGGGCYAGAAGGGGYSGGGGGGWSMSGWGGGGGSYNAGTSPSNTDAVKSGHGQVVITY